MKAALFQRMKTVSFLIILSILGLTAGCKLDIKPTDISGASSQLKDVTGIQYATNGTYAELASYNYYRFFHVLAEYSSDDVVWDNPSSDPAWNIYNYNQYTSISPALQFWQQAYYSIYAANNIIVNVKDGRSSATDQLKGENLFLRALVHFDLVRLYSKPYTQDSLGQLGIVIRDSTYFQDSPKRSTVKQTYNFILQDLIHAARLMTQVKTGSYATKAAAYALLSRVNLYMNRNNQAIAYADSVINAGQYQLLTGTTYGQYFTLNPDMNKETIFAIHRTEKQDLGAGQYELGDLYNTLNGGYGEMHPSNYYLSLINQHPEDLRLNFINPEYALDSTGSKIALKPGTADTSLIESKAGFAYHMNINGHNWPQIDITKYSNQEGFATLASPVILRLAEMYLNRAEANAKLGNLQAAIDDVNLIRTRAGLSGNSLYTLGDLKGHTTVLQVVLEERRLELAWEGQRKFDLYRNNLPMDRTYPGSQQRIMIMPDNPFILIPVPLGEISLNHNLVQNPGY